MSLGIYQAITATILLLLGCGLLTWRMSRERSRPETITAIAAVSLAGAGSYAISLVFSDPDAPNWLQSIVYTIRAIPYDIGLIALSFFLIRSIGEKYPGAQKILSWAPGVFLTCWLSAFAFAPLVNAPALEEYADFEVEFLLLKLRNVPELVWPLICALVFFRELTQKDIPDPILRLQNAAFLVACTGFAGLVAAAMYVNYVKVFVPSSAQTTEQISLALSVESVCLAVAGFGWIAGAILDYSSDELDRQTEKVEEWIRLRHDIETEMDRLFGSWLVKGRGIVGGGLPREYFYAAHTRLHEQGQVTLEGQEAGEKLLSLLWLLKQDSSRQSLVDRLGATQRELIDTPDIAAKLRIKWDRWMRYDVREDPLFEAISPALQLMTDDPFSVRPQQWRLEHQLGALLAADVGLLDSWLSRAIRSAPGEYVSTPVLSSYYMVKTDHTSP